MMVGDVWREVMILILMMMVLVLRVEVGGSRGAEMIRDRRGNLAIRRSR
jgi:hypothetical protein